MRKAIVVLFMGLSLLLAGCNGGMAPAPSPGGSAKPIDPSGNWMLTLTDQAGKTFNIAIIFHQSGSTVTATEQGFGAFNITLPNDSSVVNCGNALVLTFQNGLVQNVNQFSGTIVIANNTAANVQQPVGSISFTSTLNDAGTSMSGTYSGVPACIGLGATGNISGNEVPSVTGTWSGTLTPCSIVVSQCVPNGGQQGTLSMTLTQYDDTGEASGTFTASSIQQLVSGTASTGLSLGGQASGSPFQVGPGVLSGTTMNVVLQDTSGQLAMINGTLSTTTPNTYTGILKLYNAPPTLVVGYYLVSMTQQ